MSIAHEIAVENGVSNLSVMRFKPVHGELLDIVAGFEKVFIFEEHYPSGGLSSLVSDLFHNTGRRAPVIETFTLQDRFAQKCGGYQYALSEHGVSDEQLRSRVQELLK